MTIAAPITGQPFTYSDIDQTLKNNFVYDVDSVAQSIFNLLTTPKGSRIFLAAYGSNIESILFEPDDIITKALLYSEIINAVKTFEPRVILNTGASTITLDPTNHEFIVNLVYNIIGLTGYEFNYTLGISP